MKYILIFFLSLSIISCTHKNKEEQMQKTAQRATVSIALNNGQKWIVNDEMKPFIEKAEQLITIFNIDKNDHKIFAQALTQANNNLIQSCTMKGKSHEELHKWLFAHMALIDQLSESSSNAEIKKNVKALRNSFNTYHKYFR